MLSRLIPGWTFPRSRATTRKVEDRCVGGMTVKPQRIASLTVSLNDFPVRLAKLLSLADTSSSSVSVVLMTRMLIRKHHDVNIWASTKGGKVIVGRDRQRILLRILRQSLRILLPAFRTTSPACLPTTLHRRPHRDRLPGTIPRLRSCRD